MSVSTKSKRKSSFFLNTSLLHNQTMEKSSPSYSHCLWLNVTQWPSACCSLTWFHRLSAAASFCTVTSTEIWILSSGLGGKRKLTAMFTFYQVSYLKPDVMWIPLFLRLSSCCCEFTSCIIRLFKITWFSFSGWEQRRRHGHVCTGTVSTVRNHFSGIKNITRQIKACWMMMMIHTVSGCPSCSFSNGCISEGIISPSGWL